ncbi:hypothetical protein V5799_021278 [Amblyomma americanum]|uniref:Uncharacterized protein n=1 Tax=Amblyomma americanum TaxID=6943 RepID=A0AAQ4FPE9_AMBAM
MLMNHFVFLVQVLGFVLPGCIARVYTCLYDSVLKTLNYCNTESYEATRNIEQHGISTYGTDPPLFMARARIARVNNCIYDRDLKMLNYIKTESYDATRNIEQHGISTRGTDPPLFTATSVTWTAAATLTSHWFKSSHVSFFGTGHGGTLSEVMLRNHFVFWVQVLGFVLRGCIAQVNTCIYESDMKTLNYCNAESHDDTRNIEQHGFNTCGTDPPLFTAPSVLGFVLLGCIARVNTCIYVSEMKTLHYCNAESYDATRNIEQHGFSTYGTDPPLFTDPNILCFVLPGCIARVNTSIYGSDLKTLNYCKTETYDATRNIEQHGISTCRTDPPLFTATSVTWAAAATLTSHCFKSSHVSFFGTGHGDTLSAAMLRNNFVFLVQVLGFVLLGCIARVNTGIYESGMKTLNFCNAESYDATRNFKQRGISTSGTDPPLFTAPSVTSVAAATLMSHCFNLSHVSFFGLGRFLASFYQAALLE